MKVIGIEINSQVATLVVLEADSSGAIVQTSESAKYKIDNWEDPLQMQQFYDQIQTAFDSIKPVKISILARNAKAKGTMAPSCLSFKLEAVIQLYKRVDVSITWPQTISAFLKRTL